MAYAILTTIFILLIPFILLFLEKKKNYAKELGLKKPSTKTFYDGVRLFITLFAALYVLGVLLELIGLNDSDKVSALVKQKSTLTLLLAVTLSPLAEELLFRGYLGPRIGVLLSSLAFGLLHYGYGSTAEVIGAFVGAVIIGLEYRKNKDLIACVAGHALYNASIILLFIYFGM